MYIKLKKEEVELLEHLMFVEYEHRMNVYGENDSLSKKCLIIHDKLFKQLSEKGDLPCQN